MSIVRLIRVGSWPFRVVSWIVPTASTTTIHEVTRNLPKRDTKYLAKPQSHSPLLSKRYLPANLACKSVGESALVPSMPNDRDRESPFVPEELLLSGDRWSWRIRIPTRRPPRQIPLGLRASQASEISYWPFALLPGCSTQPTGHPSGSRSLRSTLRHRAADVKTTRCAPGHYRESRGPF